MKKIKISPMDYAPIAEEFATAHAAHAMI